LLIILPRTSARHGGHHIHPVETILHELPLPTKELNVLHHLEEGFLELRGVILPQLTQIVQVVVGSVRL